MATKPASVCHNSPISLRGLGQVVGEIDFRFPHAPQLVDGELKAVLVLIDQALDFDEVVLLKGVDGIFDVVPHLGFEMAAAVAQGEGQIRLAALLGFDLPGNHHKS